MIFTRRSSRPRSGRKTSRDGLQIRASKAGFGNTLYERVLFFIQSSMFELLLLVLLNF